MTLKVQNIVDVLPSLNLLLLTFVREGFFFFFSLLFQGKRYCLSNLKAPLGVFLIKWSFFSVFCHKQAYYYYYYYYDNL